VSHLKIQEKYADAVLFSSFRIEICSVQILLIIIDLRRNQVMSLSNGGLVKTA